MGLNLITLDEYKLSEKLQKLDQDDRYESLIAACSQLAKTYCSNTFVDYVSSDKVEEIDTEWESSLIQLLESPVISITSIEERPRFTADYVTLVEGTDFYLDTLADVVYRMSGDSKINWATGPGAVKVTYRAGYATVPEDLKLAVVDLVTYYAKDEYKPRRTIGGSSLVNDPTSTQWRNVGFPDHIKRVLDLYKTVLV